MPIKKGLSICIMHVVSSWTTAGKQIYNFLKNVNIINAIASFTCAIKYANANVSQEDNDCESSLSYDDFDEVSDPSDGESNLCGQVWFGQW